MLVVVMFGASQIHSQLLMILPAVDENWNQNHVSCLHLLYHIIPITRLYDEPHKYVQLSKYSILELPRIDCSDVWSQLDIFSAGGFS
jgi:hypothetical protein